MPPAGRTPTTTTCAARPWDDSARAPRGARGGCDASGGVGGPGVGRRPSTAGDHRRGCRCDPRRRRPRDAAGRRDRDLASCERGRPRREGSRSRTSPVARRRSRRLDGGRAPRTGAAVRIGRRSRRRHRCGRVGRDSCAPSRVAAGRDRLRGRAARQEAWQNPPNDPCDCDRTLVRRLLRPDEIDPASASSSTRGSSGTPTPPC